MNFSVKNGYIRDFGNAFYESDAGDEVHRFRFENVDIFNMSNRNFYLSGGSNTYDKKFEVIDCSLADSTVFVQSFKNVSFISTSDNVLNAGEFYFMSGDYIGFEGYDTLNLTSQFYSSNIPNIVFNDLDDVYANRLYFTTTGIYGDGPIFKPFNFCSSVASAITLGFHFNVVMQNDSYDSSDCFQIYANNFSVDMNGYIISGDGGTSDEAFVLTPSAGDVNITIKNGFVDNMGGGVLYSELVDESHRVWIDNVEFTNIVNEDVEVNGGSSTYDKELIVSNCNFNSVLLFSNYGLVEMYGNNISSANDITLTSMGTFDADVDLGGDFVGNYWRDFTCSDLGDVYSVNYGDYDYTVCNADDYTNNSITDTAPLLTSSYVGGGSGSGPGSGSSASAKSSGFDFGDVGIGGLVVLFGWLLLA